MIYGPKRLVRQYDCSMKTSDHAPLIAIAMMASRADSSSGSAEQKAVDDVVSRIGNPDVTRLAQQVESGAIRVADLAGMLSDDDVRRMAYEGALAIVNADGVSNDREQAFLAELREALGLDHGEVDDVTHTAEMLAASPVSEVRAGPPPRGTMDDAILQQAMLTGALEFLPDRLASVAILPVQLRLVYQVGQRHGQKLDLDQVKDLAAALGIGAAAQSVQGAALKLIGGLAGGLLGGLAGGAARIATGAVASFATTYALGHTADLYYQRGRQLSMNDVRELFDRFQAEARTLYPRVEQQIRQQSASLNLDGLLKTFNAR